MRLINSYDRTSHDLSAVRPIVSRSRADARGQFTAESVTLQSKSGGETRATGHLFVTPILILLLLLLLLPLLSDDDVSRTRRRTTNTRPASSGTSSSEYTQNRSRRPGHQSSRFNYTKQHFRPIYSAAAFAYQHCLLVLTLESIPPPPTCCKICAV